MAVGKRGGWGWKVPRFGMETSALSPSNIRTFLHQPLRFPLKCPNDPLKRVVRKWRFFRTFRRVLPDDGLPDALSVSGKGRKAASERRRENIAHSPFSVPRRPRSVRLPAASVRRKSGILPGCSPRAFYGCSARHLSPLWETLKKSTATLLTDCRTFKCMLSLPVMET